ncbi:MAG: hypothetical protein U1F29_04045 [Planctomycetota bacterium]
MPPTPDVRPPAPRLGLRARWRRSAAGRRATQVRRVLAAPVELFRRRAAAGEYLAVHPPALHLGEDGFARFEPGALPGLDSVLRVACARRAERQPILERVRAGRTGAKKITLDLFGDEFLAVHDELVATVLQDAWFGPVVEYLGTVPFLARITLAHSAPGPAGEPPVYHQRFHLDNDDTRHVKLYVHAHDVGMEHGPVAFLPARASERVLAALAREGHSRAADTTYDDEDVFRHASRDELVTVTGPAGSGVFADLSRCLHYGSRVERGRERAVLVVEFLRYHRLHENSTNQFAPPRVELDRVRRMLLTPPKRYPRGHFLGDLARELGP